MSNIMNNGEITADSDCMLQTFSMLKVKAKFKPRVDNLVFWLHYRFTFSAFVVGAMLSTLYDYVGEKIICMVDANDKKLDDNDDDAFQKAVQSYCYITGTYTVDKLHYGEVGVDMPHPGVGPHSADEAVTYHTYYQWVPFVLILQGAMFYMPHLIWKRWEGGLFQTIIQDLSVVDYLACDKSEKPIGNYFNRKDQYQTLAAYITESAHSHGKWSLKFIFCEFLNLVMTFKTVFVINHFLGGEFLSYGLKVISMTNMDPENRTDPMAQVFPTMGKCSFRMYGPSGTLEKRDIMCLLPTNVINEKVYVFIWFWLLILAVVGCVWLLTRVMSLVRPVRERIFTFRAYTVPRLNTKGYQPAPPSDDEPLLPTKEDVKKVLKNTDFGDYILLSQLADSMDSAMFSEFVKYLADHINEQNEDGDSSSGCDGTEMQDYSDVSTAEACQISHPSDESIRECPSENEIAL